MFRGRVRHVHFIGIGGIGMSGLAEVLRTLDFDVSGSDLKPNENTRRLEGLGVRVFIGQLRQKIERDSTQPRLILTEPGVGYRFAAGPTPRSLPDREPTRPPTSQALAPGRRSARRAGRRTFPASSRRGPATRSNVRGSL